MQTATPPTSNAALWDALASARARLAARDPQLIEDQLAIAGIASPTGDEGAKAQWIEARFRALGLSDVRRDEAGNVCGRRAGTRDLAPVTLCAHLDTVFPASTALGVTRDGQRFHGPSINDNSRGLAVMLALAAEIHAARIPLVRPIDFVATTGEEGSGDLRGAKHWFANNDAALAIAIDGAGDERIVHRALGSCRFRITFDGPGGHSWSAFGAPNAIHAASLAAARLATLQLPDDPRTTLSVGRIGGGSSVNTIPSHAWMEIDLRSTDPTMIERYEQHIRDAVRLACEQENARRVPGSHSLGATITIIGSRPCGTTDAAHPLVKSAAEITRLIGREPEFATASTDANVPIARGIPAIAIGAGGRGGDVHTEQEWFDNGDGQLGVARALAIVVAASQIT
jgi:acetylornithine deacetylase/succinyl-diaminopimelate desuccinylase-like protein